MNRIVVWSPRWHDRVVLIAEHRLDDVNEIVIRHKDFPQSYYLTAKRAKEFPREYMRTKLGHKIPMRAIPIDELAKEVITI